MTNDQTALTRPSARAASLAARRVETPAFVLTTQPSQPVQPPAVVRRGARAASLAAPRSRPAA